MSNNNISNIKAALDGERWETARRLAAVSLEDNPAQFKVRLMQHQAYSQLGDLRTAVQCLEGHQVYTDDEHLTIELLIAKDLHFLGRHTHYRGSAEAVEGLSADEYEAKYIALAKSRIQDNTELAKKLGREDELTAMSELISIKQHETPRKKVTDLELPDHGPARIKGFLTNADGSPAAGIKMVLGLEVQTHGNSHDYGKCDKTHPLKFKGTGCDYATVTGKQRSRETITDERGYFCFDNVPAGRHEFIAASLDPLKDNIACYFLAHNIAVAENDIELDLQIKPWSSAATPAFESPFDQEKTINDIPYRLLHEEKLHNPFYYDFPRQEISIELPENCAEAKRLYLCSSLDPEIGMQFQIDDGVMSFMAELPMKSDRCYAIYYADKDVADDVGNEQVGPCLAIADDGRSAVISTGCADFKIAWGENANPGAPIQSVRGVDGCWRGCGRWVLPEGITITGLKSSILNQGAIYIKVSLKYELSNGKSYEIRLTAQAEEATLKAHEVCPDIPGMAFEFSLKEFCEGRGFLHWTPENGSVHWTDLKAENRELARLQESVPWWIPPAGFGYAMTPGGLEEKDYIAIVTLQRGEWVDRYFNRICKGPVENRELDWPYPEMVGSTVSMITVHSNEDGDAYFHFKAFDGERRWALFVSDFNKNDGPDKEIAAVQHKNSSPRLQDFKDWQLDVRDDLERPFILAKKDQLFALRKKGDHPAFSAYRKEIADFKNNHDVSSGFFDAMLSADPLRLWEMKKAIAGVADTKARMVLLGRDRGDIYSPVGARCIPPYVEGYDSIVATGVFTVEEERISRAYLMLMGHMFMEPDLMNWHFNARNANFEADRAEVVSTVGLGFHCNPDAKKLIDHSLKLMKESVEVYTNPDSGKWFENPPCYYQVAARSRLTMIYHFKEHGIADCTEILRLKSFFSWALNLVTPPYPRDYKLLRDGCDAATYATVEKGRKIPPIGDHASWGRIISELYAIAGKLYRDRDPEFAETLTWLYQSGKGEGCQFPRTAMFFEAMEEEDLKPAKAPVLTSRRLEGFGSVFRGNFDQPNEFYLLMKLGPGGYRYHNTEGSIILISEGKPLIFDGGEAGETWRHTTLSFGETHRPLSPGHIERFASFSSIDFSQGVNPLALQPGEIGQLNDVCEHELVQVAHERFNEPNPANSRSLLWVKNDYIILHDQLNLAAGRETHWHLQAIADDHTGDWQNGYCLKGRYGTDLQVLLPDQNFEKELVRQDAVVEYSRTAEESFSMRHLQLSTTSPDHILAVIRPLNNGDSPISASLLKADDALQGVKVSGENIDDIHWLDRNTTEFSDNKISFKGRYGSVLRRGEEIHLNLLDGEFVEINNIRLCSNGPAASLHISKTDFTLEAEGVGLVEVQGLNFPIVINLDENNPQITKNWKRN